MGEIMSVSIMWIQLRCVTCVFLRCFRCSLFRSDFLSYHDEKYKCITHVLRTEALVTAETVLWIAAMVAATLLYLRDKPAAVNSCKSLGIIKNIVTCNMLIGLRP